jgi:ribosomal protein S27AE
MEVKMIELQDSRKSREDGHNYFDRTGSTGMTQEERKQRMEWYEQSMKNFDFNEPQCPKCGNFTFFGLIHKEKGWQYYHCGCGFQAHREVKLNVSEVDRKDNRLYKNKQDLHTFVNVPCLRCGCDITVNLRQAYRGRKYCKVCNPLATSERMTGKKRKSTVVVA